MRFFIFVLTLVTSLSPLTAQKHAAKDWHLKTYMHDFFEIRLASDEEPEDGPEDIIIDEYGGGIRLDLSSAPGEFTLETTPTPSESAYKKTRLTCKW